MPSSRRLITSTTLSSSAASVTFSGIPATYTDLVLKISPKGSDTTIGSKCRIEFNADSSTKYSGTVLYWAGTTLASFRNTSNTYINDVYGMPGSSSGGTPTGIDNVFGSIEVYIPNYNSTSSKPIGIFGVSERNNATTSESAIQAGLYTGASAISSIKLTTNLTNFVSGSSFFLYGLFNS